MSALLGGLDATALTRRTLVLGFGALAVGAGSGVRSASAASPIAKFKPSGGGSADHSAFDALLAPHVKPDGEGYNRVDYRSLKASHGALKAYVGSLEQAAPSSFGRAAAHAYWINLYNAKTLDVVLERYPVSSIKKIALGGGGLFGGGPWSKPILTVEGEALSLDDVEHRIVRPLFSDPLSHYALNCASYSCPNLATTAYTAENLQSLMTEGAAAYVNHPRGVSVTEGNIRASKIYSWYAVDFGGKAKLKDHWKAFATPELASSLDAADIGGYDYDWSLNDV